MSIEKPTRTTAFKKILDLEKVLKHLNDITRPHISYWFTGKALVDNTIELYRSNGVYLFCVLVDRAELKEYSLYEITELGLVQHPAKPSWNISNFLKYVISGEFKVASEYIGFDIPTLYALDRALKKLCKTYRLSEYKPKSATKLGAKVWDRYSDALVCVMPLRCID